MLAQLLVLWREHQQHMLRRIAMSSSQCSPHLSLGLGDAAAGVTEVALFAEQGSDQ